MSGEVAAASEGRAGRALLLEVRERGVRLEPADFSAGGPWNVKRDPQTATATAWSERLRRPAMAESP